jgi:hypothetical protein
MRSSEKAHDNVQKWLQSDMCQAFSTLTHTSIVNAPIKQKGQGDDKSEDGESSECISYSMVLQHTDTLLDYTGQRGYEYSDIIAARKTHTAMQ